MSYKLLNGPFGTARLTPHVYHDERGSFAEVFNFTAIRNISLRWFPNGVMQISHSFSYAGVLRGLHFQCYPPMGKMMRVLSGKAFVINVDIDPRSTTFGQYDTVLLSPGILSWAPATVGRAFIAIEDCEMEYWHNAMYDPNTSMTVNIFDPDINIDWKNVTDNTVTRNPKLDGNWIMSEKDKTGMSLTEWKAKALNLRRVY